MYQIKSHKYYPKKQEITTKLTFATKQCKIPHIFYLSWEKIYTSISCTLVHFSISGEYYIF